MAPSHHHIQGIQQSHTVTIKTHERVTLESLVAQTPNLESIDQRIRFDCVSGSTIDATWKGFPFLPLLETVGIPGDTTHFTIESTDGQRGCISVQEAANGLIAYERDSELLDAPRFVAPDIMGPRAVKDIRSIEAVSLEPGEPRENYESITILQEESG